MKLRIAHILHATTALAAATLMATSASAQDNNATDQQPEDAAEGEDIVVTAQRRSENLQDVPISIAAFSEQRLVNTNVLAVTDLGRIATNFSATRATQTSNLRLTIRGIGAPGNTATEPSVAAFLDGVYIPRPGSVIGTFLDIEGVEVLRGPQGTLFGRNASVGALSLRSAAPKDTFSAAITGEAANADRYRINGYVNVPLTDNIAIRIAGQRQWFAGFWTNQLDGSTFGGLDESAVRGSLKAEFGNVTWIVRGDYAESTGDGFPNIDLDPSSISATQLATLRTRLGGVLPDTNLFDQQGNQIITANVDDRQWGFSSNLSLDVGNFTVRLINSYRDWQNDQLDGDIIFTPLPLASRVGSYSSKSHNHELQLISPQRELLGGALDFVAGLYYFQEDYRIVEQLQLSSQYCNTLVPAGAQRTACNTGLAAGAGVNATNLDFNQSLESFAAYGQATLHFTDTLDLTLGGRWTKEDKDGRFVQLVPNAFAGGLRAAENTPLTLSDERFTYRASLNYRPTDDILLFANYSTGFKSGGFNSGGGTPALGQRRLFARETVDNYEIGARTSWLDNALTVNATLFRMDIAGYQDRSFDGVSFVVRNAGNLRHQGLELDMSLSPVRRFRVNASLAYLDSEFTDYAAGSALPGIGGTQNLTGTRNNYAPEFTGNVGFEWSGDIGSSGLSWVATTNLSFVSDINIGAVTDNNRQTVQDGYSLLGARITLNGPNDRWSLALFGSNLLDKGFAVSKFYQVLDAAFGLRNGVFPGSTAVRVQEGDPRTYGVSATFRF